MDNEKKNEPIDPEQKKWDDAGPEKATGRAGGAGGDSYTEGEEAEEGSPETTSGGESLGAPTEGPNKPPTEKERTYGGSHTAGKALKKEEDSEMKGGTPKQGPTTGGMGAAGGGHDTDETDVWGDKDRNK